MTHREEFRAYMKAANSTSNNYDGSHLSEAQMLAYWRGDLPGAEREAAQAHLIGCQQCIALFRNARDFLEPAREEEEDVTAHETNQAWQVLLERVQPAASTSAGGTGANVRHGDFQRAPTNGLFLESRVTLALAATLLILLSALGWLTWRLRQEQQSQQQSQEVAEALKRRQLELEERLSQLEQSAGDQLKQERDRRIAAEAQRDQLDTELAAVLQPGENIPVYSATLSSERGTDVGIRLNLAARAPAVRLRLFRNKPYEFQKYAFELLDERGGVVWKISGLRPARDDGALSLRFNRATLNAGKYKLRLFGQSEDTNKQLGEYGLTVTVGR